MSRILAFAALFVASLAPSLAVVRTPWGAAGNVARVTKTGTQSISHGVESAVTWSTATFDTCGCWSSGANTRLTAPGNASVVQLVLRSDWPGGSARRDMQIRKNGATQIALEQFPDGSIIEGIVTLKTGPLAVSGGDYFEAIAFQTQAGSGPQNFNPNGTAFFAIEVLQ